MGGNYDAKTYDAATPNALGPSMKNRRGPRTTNAVQAKIEKVQVEIVYSSNDITAKKMGGRVLAVRPIFKLRLIRVGRSLTLSRSYKDSHIDANSLVRDNREWLRIRVDAFCGAFFS